MITPDLLVLDYTGSIINSEGWVTDEGWWTLCDQGLYVKLDGTGLKREPFSITPLFFSINLDFLVASTSWKAVLAYLQSAGTRTRCDPKYVWRYLEFQCPPTSRTLCEGIRLLRSGETIELLGKKPQSRLVSFTKRLDTDDSLDLRAELEKNISVLDLSSTAFHLSAGLDSSLLALLAGRIHTISVKTATIITRGEGASQELDIIRRLSDDAGFDLSEFDFRELDILKTADQLVEALGFPTAHPSHLSRFLLDNELVKQGIGTIVTGRGADESMAGYDWHRNDFSDPVLHQKRVRSTAADDLSTVLSVSGMTLPWDGWRNARVIDLRERIQYDWWTIMESWGIIDRSFSLALDVEYSHPFLLNGLARRLLGMADDSLLKNGLQKIPLRTSFLDVYPDYLLKQPKRGFRFDIGLYLKYLSFDAIMGVILNPEALNRHIKASGVSKMIRQTLSGERNFGWQIWSLMLSAFACDKFKLV
ncbi:MAG: asparagine synthase C-terminal domain-containing protein [Proteobacteria bacterium]|nr:asparagine synthase C-terminal domain-containing protein [Pseudomonadota bacterium]